MRIQFILMEVAIHAHVWTLLITGANLRTCQKLPDTLQLSNDNCVLFTPYALAAYSRFLVFIRTLRVKGCFGWLMHEGLNTPN
jgi:hypothetical protein